MKYRRFDKLDWKVSALGFGCMRLPTLGSRSEIDEPEAIRMIRYAIDHGVNYLDTAYPYHGGNSERLLGKALQDGYRDKVRVATKLPVGRLETREDADRILAEQLEKLQTDHIDFYLFHGLRKPRWETVQQFDLLDWADKALADGRIRHMGFSFHDSFEVFKEIVDAYNWTFCQIQYNYMDVENQAGTAGLKYAASKGMGVVIMEPLLGGQLVTPPDAVQAIWDAVPVKRTPVDWALQWLWNQPEVSVVLSGMSTMQQVQENLASADVSGAGTLTEEELALVDRVRQTYRSLIPVPCTNCRYCMPCPNGVNIPRNLRLFNSAIIYNQLDSARQQYTNGLAEEERASACIQCRQCEDLCPQSILISEWMPEVDAVLGQGKPYIPRS